MMGLAMVWVQDCYPFVHTGFVEQFLWRRRGLGGYDPLPSRKLATLPSEGRVF